MQDCGLTPLQARPLPRPDPIPCLHPTSPVWHSCRCTRASAILFLLQQLTEFSLHPPPPPHTPGLFLRPACPRDFSACAFLACPCQYFEHTWHSWSIKATIHLTYRQVGGEGTGRNNSYWPKHGQSRVLQALPQTEQLPHGK